jgi:hypothetical protein
MVMKTRRIFVRSATLLLLFGLGATLLVGTDPSPALADNNATTRPIGDFVDAQGTYDIGFLFVPPVDNYIGWTDPNSGLSMSVDYAGIADDYYGGVFGTTFGGTVTERPLADGRAEVTVVLQTKDALTYVVDGFDFASDPLVFGARPNPSGLQGSGVALGNSVLIVKFINTAPGAALPDLLQLFIDPAPGQVPLSIGIKAMASGTLPDGSPARAEVVQTGLFFTNANGNSRVAFDAFPAERVKVNAVGK